MCILINWVAKLKSTTIHIIPHYHLEKIKPFDTNLEPTRPNLSNGRVS